MAPLISAILTAGPSLLRMIGSKSGGNVQQAVDMLLEGVDFPASASAKGIAPVWEFDDSPNGYRALAQGTQALLESAFASGDTQATFKFQRFTYIVDLTVRPSFR